MTAIVGVLNKHGVALAADSAVTINVNNGHKILNSANKIIRLSKRKPMAVMIYSSASFMSTPWDIIIKMYRNERITTSFDSVEEYVSDFTAYLKNNGYFSSKEVEDYFFHTYIVNMYEMVTRKAIEEIGSTITDKNKAFLYRRIEDGLRRLEQICVKRSRCPQFEDYSYEAFKKDYHLTICNLFEKRIDPSIDKDAHITIIEKAVYATIVSSLFIGPMTGLVFVGYGDKEIYPTLIPMNVSFVVSGRLKCAIDDANIACIGDGDKKFSGSIRPFAQKDVINTILSGVDDKIQELYIKVTEEAMKTMRKGIADSVESIESNDKKISNAIRKVDIQPIMKGIINKLDDFIQKEYVSQLMETVKYLDKEDLASMAESLISLTSLKRRMTSSEETVGGPVDVAVITKGDGFVWLKHKKYFDKDLNQPYFENYNRE